jgi:hypothetical protein
MGFACSLHWPSIEIAIVTAKKKKKLKQAGSSYCVSMPGEVHAAAVSKKQCNMLCKLLLAGRKDHAKVDENCSLYRLYRLRCEWPDRTCTDAPQIDGPLERKPREKKEH